MLEHLPGDGAGVLQNFEGEDVRDGGDRHKHSLKKVGVELVDSAGGGLVDELAQDPKGCVLEGKDVVVVVLVGVESDLIHIFQRNHRADQKPHHVLDCLFVGLLLLDLVNYAREQAPKELFRLLRYLLHKILLPCDQDSFAEVLHQNPHEKLGVGGHSRGFDLILDHVGVPFDLVLDLLPDSVEEGGGDCEVLGGKGQDG